MRNENEEMIEVSLSRLGIREVTVSIPEESTLQDALTKAGWSLNAGEKCYVDGIEGNLSSVLDDGDTVSIVANKVGGIK